MDIGGGDGMVMETQLSLGTTLKGLFCVSIGLFYWSLLWVSFMGLFLVSMGLFYGFILLVSHFCANGSFLWVS